jgi:hypothetical protein
LSEKSRRGWDASNGGREVVVWGNRYMSLWKSKNALQDVP